MTVKVYRVDRGSFIDRQPVLLPSLVWLLALGAALCALFVRGVNISAILPLFAVACVPGVLGLLLTRIADREWVQIVLMLSWAALGLLASLSFGFNPMAILFIAVPTLSALFEREKVLEGTIIAAMIAGVIWFANRQGFLPEAPTWEAGVAYWAKLSAIAGLLAFGLATLITASSRRSPIADPARTYWRDGVEGGLFEYDSTGRLIGSNEQGLAQFSGDIPTALLEYLPVVITTNQPLRRSLKRRAKPNNPKPSALPAHPLRKARIMTFVLRPSAQKAGCSILMTGQTKKRKWKVCVNTEPWLCKTARIKHFSLPALAMNCEHRLTRSSDFRI